MPRGAETSASIIVGGPESNVVALKAEFGGGDGEQGIRSMEHIGDSGYVHTQPEPDYCSR